MKRLKLYLKLLRESYIFALKAIVVNKIRTVLSLSGITIGIFSIISVFTVFDSIRNTINESVNSLGSNVIYIQKWPWEFSSDYPWWDYIKRPEAKLSELTEVQKRSQASQAAAYILSTMRKAKNKNLSINATIVAVSHDYPEVTTIEFESGRYFSMDESARGKPAAIIGNEVARLLYGSTDPIGKKIKVFDRNLEIIGVLKKEGFQFGNSVDYQIIMPVQFARQFIDLRSDNIGSAIIVKSKPLVSNEELTYELRGIMRSVRKLKPGAKDNFAINKSDILTMTFEGLFRVINTVGWIIGGFSLLVGGFGIANIMFVSVRERTPQIGIQKSMGAKNTFILQEFLFESVFLSLLGGLAGLLLIYLITLLLRYMADMHLTLTIGNIMLGITVSAIIGLVSGFVPALSASKLDPVEAMRSSF